MTVNHTYEERISSNRMEALFLVLTCLFLLLSVWRWKATSLDTLAIVFLCLCGFFLFYSLNYRTLVIRITPESVKLKFGIFTWTVPMDNVEECRLEELPILMKLGGAGIHFMNVGGRYRASFNFLEYPRLVIRFRKKRGLVRDISFSTRQPDEVLRYIHQAM